MKLKSIWLLLNGLVCVTFTLNACGMARSQTSTLQPSPTLATSTRVPVTLTLTSTPTATKPATPTSWISALLTAAPTLMNPVSTLPPDCGTVIIGHAGTQFIENSQKIIVQGTAVICGDGYLDGNSIRPFPVIEAMLDLDTGTFDLESADLFFCPSGGSDTFYYYCDVNNSKIRVYSIFQLKEREPTFEDCSNVTQPFEYKDENEPVYICVITNQGNVSRVKVEKFNSVTGAGSSEEISFITWEK
jgi:hypothetical protein